MKEMLERVQDKVDNIFDDEQYCDELAAEIASYKKARVKDKEAILCLAHS